MTAPAPAPRRDLTTSASAARPRRALARHFGRTAVVATLALAALGTTGTVAAHPAAAAAAALEVGDRGSLVEQLQRRLGLTADGVYGPRTRKAVRRFQRRRGLTVDGVAGTQTLRALGLSVRTIRRDRAASGSGTSATLARIARCESGGDPTAVSADGRYRGKYQFSRATWRAMGGKGDPAAAPEAEQDRRAAKLLAQRGTAPWPSCGR